MNEQMEQLCDKHFGSLWQDDPNRFWRMFMDVRENTKGTDIPLTKEEWHVILAALEIVSGTVLECYCWTCVMHAK